MRRVSPVLAQRVGRVKHTYAKNEPYKQSTNVGKVVQGRWEQSDGHFDYNDCDEKKQIFDGARTGFPSVQEIQDDQTNNAEQRS